MDIVDAAVKCFGLGPEDGVQRTGIDAAPRGDNAGLGGVVLSGSSKVSWLNTHNMAKTVKAWATKFQIDQLEEGHQTSIQPMGVDKLPSDYRCPNISVVVHDGPHERVFTESEVKAMLDELKEANRALSELRTTTRRHGISLDPA